jgi:hypothetical protein
MWCACVGMCCPLRVEVVNAPNCQTCLDSLAPPSACRARPWSSHETPFMNSRGSAEGRPALDSYLVPTLTNLRAAYGGAAQEFELPVDE